MILTKLSEAFKGYIFIVLSLLYVVVTHFLKENQWFNVICYIVLVLGAAHMVVFFYLVYKRSIWSTIAFLSVFPLWPVFLLFVGFNFTKGNTGDFSILTYNVGMFTLDRLDYPDTLSMKDPSRMDKFMEEVQKIKPDVICLQEFYTNDTYSKESVLTKLVNLGYHYYYMSPLKLKGYRGYFGVITLSRHPMTANSYVNFRNDGMNEYTLNRAICSEVQIDSKRVKVINLHLHSMSIRIGKEIGEDPAYKVKNIASKLIFGANERKKQLDEISQWWNERQVPTIVVGDFNDLPFSENYLRMKKKFSNSHEFSGLGLGITYHKFPFFVRIDNQFFSKDLEAKSSEVLSKIRISDHLPLVVRYVWAKSKK